MLLCIIDGLVGNGPAGYNVVKLGVTLVGVIGQRQGAGY